MYRVQDIPADELKFSAIHASGRGGQNVNKVATAIQLHFDIWRSSLPDRIKQRLAALRDHRITREGVVVIKASRYRYQERNREDARQRLDELLQKAQEERKARRATRPTRASKERRLDTKKQRGAKKNLRGKVRHDD